MSEQHYDAVVIGSGFGGSVNALRLAEAGRSVLVLERGQRYGLGMFPRDVTDSDRVFWRYPLNPRSQGLYDIGVLSGMAVVAASGVGGGSLIYANLHVRPDPLVFDDPAWPDELNRTSLEPYYDTVADKLQVAPIPREIQLPKRDACQRVAGDLHVKVFDPDQAVAWVDAPGGFRKACRLCAQCEFGCQYGSKHTLDYNYLAQAQQGGAVVRDRAYVMAIEPHNSGYTVHYHDLTRAERRVSVVGKRVIVACGTIATNKLLLRCRDQYKTLHKLSSRLGCGYSGNGNFQALIQGAGVDLDPCKGPEVTNVFNFFERTPRFTVAMHTFHRPAMEFLAAMSAANRGWRNWLGSLVWSRLERSLPSLLEKGVSTTPYKPSNVHVDRADHTALLVAMGQDNANGRLVLKDGRLDMVWDYYRENRELVNRMEKVLSGLAESFGGRYVPLLTWNIAKRTITFHPLGGCALSTSQRTGVVAPHGEVHGYPGLFVADGSVIPTALGFHPAMTIAAVSERIAAAVVESYSF